jgi:hypothetical protein
MQLQELPPDLPPAVQHWAEALRSLAHASGERSSATLARRLHCAPATLSRYLRGQRPLAAYNAIVPRLVALAAERGQQTASLSELRALRDRAVQAAGAEPVDPGQPATSSLDRADGDTPRHRKATLVALAGLLVVLSAAGLSYLRWGLPSSPHSAGESASSTAPAPAWRCALVRVHVSPVLINPGDPAPLKAKHQNERVRLVELPLANTPAGVYQAVVVSQPPKSPTGYGWMPANDLTPIPCQN